MAQLKASFKNHSWRSTTVLAAVTAIVAACSQSDRVPSASMYGRSVDPKTGTSASPRLYSEGDLIPKGGGIYKTGSPYQVSGRWYTPREEPDYNQVGTGSWYGEAFHGRKTANGEIFDMNALTAAHPTLPLPSYAYVTNLDTGRTLLVRINDRGPYANDRVIDLSRRSARELGYEGRGLSRVRVQYAGPAPLNGDDRHERQFLANQSRGNFAPRYGSAQSPRSSAPAPVAVNDRDNGSYRPALVPSQAPDSGGWSPLAYRGLGAPRR